MVRKEKAPLMNKMTHCGGTRSYRVIDESEGFYILAGEDDEPFVVKKEHCKVAMVVTTIIR